MTVSLSSGPVMGVLSASGSSPVFTTTPGQVGFVHLFTSRLAIQSKAGWIFKIMRSADGVSGWTEVESWAQPHWQVILPDGAETYYRIDATFSAGSVFYCANSSGLGWPFSTWPYVIEAGDKFASLYSLTTSQISALYTLLLSPLTSSQLALPLTIYKQCAGGVLANLTVPAGASLVFEEPPDVIAPILSPLRRLRASSVQVNSLVDVNGQAVAAAPSFVDPTTIYTPGQTVTARDPWAGTPRASSGAFGSSTNTTGIRGYATPLEAANSSSTAFNLAALGL